MCVINTNCQGLLEPDRGELGVGAELRLPDCWGFQLLLLSSRLPHAACVTRALPSAKPLNSVLTSHSCSLQTLQAPCSVLAGGKQPVPAHCRAVAEPPSPSAPQPLLLWFLGGPCTALAHPLRDPRVHTPIPAAVSCSEPPHTP